MQIEVKAVKADNTHWGVIQKQSNRVCLFTNVWWFHWLEVYCRLHLLHMSHEDTFTVFQEVAVFQEVHVSMGSWVNDMQKWCFCAHRGQNQACFWCSKAPIKPEREQPGCYKSEGKSILMCCSCNFVDLCWKQDVGMGQSECAGLW